MANKALVVGSGAIGLRTALELLKRKIPVVLKSKHHPLNPKTCSMGAGGLWMPYKCDDRRVDAWAKETLDELLNESKHNKAVEIVPTVFLTKKHTGDTVDNFAHFNKNDYKDGTNLKSILPEWSKDPRISFQHVSIEMLAWQNNVFKMRIPSQEVLLKAGYTNAWFFKPPIVDAPRMLSDMLKEIESNPLTNDVDVEMENPYASTEEVIDDAKKHGCDSIINCTGLGAATICNDEKLFSGRGVLLSYDRECSRLNDNDGNFINDAAILTEEGWGTTNDPVYIIPRGDKLLIGGSFYEGDTEDTLRDTERKRLQDNALLMGISPKSKPVSEWAGMRPCREEVRLELDENSPINGPKIVHCYGHGGSGWTTFVGCARAAVNLLCNPS
jgi:D-amino-acid oxidase